MSLTLTSPAFPDKAEVPRVHTCQGGDVSPPLSWSGLPAGTRSLALIVDDPDAPDPAAPKTTWVHWVVYNLPPAAGGLPEGAGVGPGGGAPLPAGAREGVNDWGGDGYRGPCPPIGRHRYMFKLFALDAVLPDLGRPTKLELEQAMDPHVLESAHLTGTYEKAAR